MYSRLDIAMLIIIMAKFLKFGSRYVNTDSIQYIKFTPCIFPNKQKVVISIDHCIFEKYYRYGDDNSEYKEIYKFITDNSVNNSHKHK